MHDYERAALQDAVNTRMRTIRTWVPQAMLAAQQEAPGIPIRALDGYSACQYLATLLWRFHDAERVQNEPDAALFDSLVEKIVGAALFRLSERQKALERLEL